MRIENLQNENRKYAKSIGNFHVLEYVQDASVSPMNAMNEYFMSKMNVRRRQVVGRVKTYEAIIKGENIPEPGVPESFKVLLKELQSLALDVRVLDQDNNEVRLLESSEYEVTDFKKVLDEGNGYRRNSREEEAEYKAGGMSTVTLNEDGTEDAVDSDDEADFDMADDFDDDYGDGNSDEY